MAKTTVDVVVPPGGATTQAMAARSDADGAKQQAVVLGADGGTDVVDVGSLLQEVAIALASLSSALALVKDPASGRLRTQVDTLVGLTSLPPGTATIGNVGISGFPTIATVGNLTNLGAGGPVGAVAAAPPAYAQMVMAAQHLRSQIVVS